MQNSAPHASGGFHCYETYDTMCYNDGGSYFTGGGTLHASCPDVSPTGMYAFDCHGDDYYNVAPAQGTYLADHWDVADSSWLTAPGVSGESLTRFTVRLPLGLSCPTSVSRRSVMASTTALRYDEKEWRPRPTLTGRDYTFEVWDEERERIWWGDWVAFGREEEVPDPGDYVVRDVAGESVFIIRNALGELNGFYNVCSHRGTKFLDDDDRGNRRKAFTCPYHAWIYDLDGRLIGTPNVQEDELFDRSRYPLHRSIVSTSSRASSL